MKTRLRFLLFLCALAALVAAFLLLAAPTVVGLSAPAILPPENESQPPDALSPNAIEASAPVVFPPDPGWPEYAQREITVYPEPPVVGQPTEICAEVASVTRTMQTVALEFGVADFGIGMPFALIGAQAVDVPPYGKARACVVWVPREPGHRCIQVILRQPQWPDLKSQRNIDIWEILTPGVPSQTLFPVRNSTGVVTNIELSPTHILPGWTAFLTPPMLSDMGVDETRPVTLTVIPPAQGPLGSQEPIVDVEARSNGGQGPLIGGFRKMDWPPVPLHRFPDPPYAENEISIEPYPPRAGEPTEICAELRNPTPVSQTVILEFAIASFGIGQPFAPIGDRAVVLPPFSLARHCVMWVPPVAGHFCAQVSLIDPEQHYVAQHSQRNMDVGEVFHPGQPTQPFVFPVRNPGELITTIELTGLVRLPGWVAVVYPLLLPNVGPGETRPVTLTVFAPDAPLPPDETPVVDVEAYTSGQLIGGFRKLYRPPVPIHRPQDPIYAESEIHINPYPPREREPTEICVDVRNPTDERQTITVTFGVANFGIGLPFHDIVRPISMTVPANSFKPVCVTWVPPFGGRFCARVTLQTAGHEPVWSQRNMDVGEILEPGKPSTLPFPVGNPTQGTVTVTLGMVLHKEWNASLSQDVLPNMQPGETRVVTLTVTPPLDAPEPEGDAPLVDVEGYIGPELIGGFRKLYHPPVPIHRPKDPPYAESEIFVDPYPTRVGAPTLLGVVVGNPTPATQQVRVSFSVAHFGIGMPFTTTGIVSPSAVLTIPPFGVARANTLWIPWLNGHFCVQVTLQSASHEPVSSQRNVDVGEPLNPTRPHTRIIEVRNPMTEAVTITLGLINHRPDWIITLAPTVLANVLPGVVKPVTLTVQPPSWEGLADEQPIADVEAYVNGELIGGIRKIAKPPIPLHKPQDRPYAESEISVTPYPIQAGKPHTITTEIANTSEDTQTIRILFGVANFGVGIPFTNTNIVPTMTVVELGPGVTQTVSAVWTPPSAGHWCIQIILQDPNGQYPPQRSQRNVDVERQPYIPCHPFTKEFLLQNATPLTVTVTLGASAINLPPGWTYSTNITETTLLPYQSITVTVTITPPCGLATQGVMTPLSAMSALDTGGASGPPTLDVEGYIDGNLAGGIEIQLEGTLLNVVYLPVVMKNP